jgi:hypothetical protein
MLVARKLRVGVIVEAIVATEETTQRAEVIR